MMLTEQWQSSMSPVRSTRARATLDVLEDCIIGLLFTQPLDLRYRDSSVPLDP